MKKRNDQAAGELITFCVKKKKKDFLNICESYLVKTGFFLPGEVQRKNKCPLRQKVTLCIWTISCECRAPSLTVTFQEGLLKKH